MKDSIQFPTLKAKGKLYIPLIINSLGGFWKGLDEEGKNYFKIMCILIDKSVYEYNLMRKLVVEEMKNNDRLAYRFRIIGHLENAINAVHRVDKIIKIILKGIHRDNKREYREQIISSFIESEIINAIEGIKISTIRHRIEHSEEDIFNNKIKGFLFVDIDENYRCVVINGKSLKISDFVLLIDKFEELILSIQKKFPKIITKDSASSQ